MPVRPPVSTVTAMPLMTTTAALAALAVREAAQLDVRHDGLTLNEVEPGGPEIGLSLK
jgi:hypothetical protein